MRIFSCIIMSLRKSRSRRGGQLLIVHYGSLQIRIDRTLSIIGHFNRPHFNNINNNLLLAY